MKVRCIHNKGIENSYLTFDKIYDVIEYDESKCTITIRNDNGKIEEYYYDNGLLAFDWFEDATPYIREEKLKELGIC